MLVAISVSMASSHREAPLTSNDPLTDNVDVYAFRSPDNQDMITLIATYVPLQVAHGGPNYYNFGENIRYEIHIDNDASIPGDEIVYRFTFKLENEDPTTFFNIRLGAQNNKATYTLERSMDGGASFDVIVTDGVVPPTNIGPRSINSGVGLGTTYDALFNAGITTATTGEMVFAGPTDDPFFVDLGGIFDLGDAPRQVGESVDGLACLNVSALAIQVPIATLRKAGAANVPANILDADYVIGVWASASRPAMSTISSTDDPTYSGDWIQVSRLGMPLTNEAVIPVGQKDFWNRISPYDEISETTLDQYFYNPELALYMDDAQFGGAVPGFAPLRIQTNSLGAFNFTNGNDGLFALKGSAAVAGTALDDAVFGTLLLPGPGQPRSVDLWPVFHTGVPNVIPYQLATGKGGNPLAAGKPFINNFLPNGGDMLRLNMAVPATPRDDANFSTLGLIQAAAIGLTVAPFNTTTDLEFIPNMDGFPNGRRLEDDVTRIELQAVAGVVLAAVGLWYDDYDPMTSPSPVTQDLVNVLTYTTGVEKNDRLFTGSFPYLAQPFRGTNNCSESIPLNQDGNVVTDATFYASSNNSGRVGVFNYQSDGSFSKTDFASAAADADGIYYDDEADVLYQLNRTANVINAYSAVAESLASGVAPSVTATSTSDFINGREIAVAGNKLVVAQDANGANGMVNAFYIYSISATSITLDKVYTADINLWGIHLDGNVLYAIQDNSNNVATYTNFLDQATGPISPTSVASIEGIGRTHGMTYERDGDIMILTDIGDAGSATDGAFSVIKGWAAASADGMVSSAEQIRIEGNNTGLGNPVDIAFDAENRIIIVAERANSGGRILGFRMPMADGNMAPTYNSIFAGASAVYLSGAAEKVMSEVSSRMFMSSNTTGLVGVFDLLEDFSFSSSTFNSQAMDADGIFYDDEADVLYQLNRTDNVINAYSQVNENLLQGMMPVLTATSTSDFINGREIAVSKNRLVVAQDASPANGDVNAFVLYDISPTSITFNKMYTPGINLWGIHAEGEQLFAIEDNSNNVLQYDDFFSQPAGPISTTISTPVEGLVRTHGLTYDAENDQMILTDIGDPTSDSDGALVIVDNYSVVIVDLMIQTADQVRIEGPNTLLGNPVDVAIDKAKGLIYVAERANSGGRFIAFDLLNAVGNDNPFYTEVFAGASAVYISGADDFTNIVGTGDNQFEINLFPNPAHTTVEISFVGDQDLYSDSTLEIFSVDGKLIHSSTDVSKTNNIDVSNYSAGMYIALLKNKEYTQEIKFNKQ